MRSPLLKFDPERGTVSFNYEKSFVAVLIAINIVTGIFTSILYLRLLDF
ncbi:MAG: hypothetical protein ABJG78_14905 [Cyclobacteriaceae bacterium]